MGESKAIQIKNESSDFDVILKILNGEKDLYELLMRRNNQRLYRVIRSYITVEDDILDVMQNSYLKAYENLHKFRKEASFSTWLIRIGINEALGRLNREQKHLKNTFGLDTIKIISISDKIKSNPEKIMIENETKELLERAISELAPNYKIPYILKEIEGLSIEDIADSIGITESNVKVRIHRAKSQLKESLFSYTNSMEVFEFGASKCDCLVSNIMGQIV